MERHEEIDRLNITAAMGERRAACASRRSGGGRVCSKSGDFGGAGCGRRRRSGRSSACSALSSWASPPVDGGRAVRSVNLLKLAFDAELLRLRAMMARAGTARGLRRHRPDICPRGPGIGRGDGHGWPCGTAFESIPATLILLGVNLVIAAIFGVLAARSSPGHTEQEALRVRRQALDAARGTLAFTAAVPAVTRLLAGRRHQTRRWRIPFMR